MQTELSFLLELLLNHKLTKPTKEVITNRIKEVEANLSISKAPATYTYSHGANFQPGATPAVQHGATQSASTIALLQKHGTLEPQAAPTNDAANGLPPSPVPHTSAPPTHPTVIAQTPAAAQALANRQAKIDQALSGKAPKGQTSPPKM